MREVSTKVFAILYLPLKQKGLALEDVVIGTRVSAAKLRDKKERIDWEDYVAIMRNIRRHFTDEEYLEAGRSYMWVPVLRFASVIARLLFTPLDFYRWANKPRDGLGNQMFSCIRATHREIAADVIELDLTLPDGFEVCWDFFLIAAGNMEEVPRLFGLPRTKVTLSPIPRGGRFHIVVPLRTPIFARIWRALTWPFTARAAARELKAAHEALLEGYQELDSARTELAAYQANLEQLVDQRTAELRQARDELANTVAQLREAQSARERFFGNVSHEIRTPLSLILLAAADIERRAGSKLDARETLNLASINESARKLVRLVDELLLLAAAQEGKLRIHPEPTDLAALLTQLVGAWRPAAEAADLDIITILPSTLTAIVDPVAFERVATNLVSNAVKFTPRGGHIVIELEDGPTGLRLSVTDTGPGIADELRGRLFGRFERETTDRHRKPGTGIGLALVKQLVEAHGGAVAALDRATGGCELRVLLAASAVVRDATASSARLRLDSERPFRPTIESGARFEPTGVSAGTVVVAEDDARLAEAVARLLAERYTVFVAFDCAQALELVRKQQPQLLVTDVDMPGMSGIVLAEQFRVITGDRLAPIIILSAVVDLGTRVSGLEAGAVDYITKPFDPRELMARVDAQFRMRDLAMRMRRAEQLTSMGILTAGLAHELRNPANAIVNAIAPLTEHLPTDLTRPGTGVRQLLDVMGSGAMQLAFLSRQLLGFGRGGAELERRPAQLADLVDRSIALAQPALDRVDVRISLDDRELMCAVPLVIQALTNLIENAGAAAGAGGWIEIAARPDGEHVVIELTDSGGGVPAELRERVFEPFFTTKPPGAGVGLGLSLARSIVHRHGGTLDIRDRVGRAAFVVQLPCNSVPGPRSDAL